MVGSRWGQGLLLLLTVIQLWIILLLVICHNMVIRANQGFGGWNHCAVVVVGSCVDYGITGYEEFRRGIQN